jgi:hypothetical protein
VHHDPGLARLLSQRRSIALGYCSAIPTFVTPSILWSSEPAHFGTAERKATPKAILNCCGAGPLYRICKISDTPEMKIAAGNHCRSSAVAGQLAPVQMLSTCRVR